MTSKLLICPWFGPTPKWFDSWWRNISGLHKHGYDVLLDRQEDGFAKRVRDRLGVTWPEGDGRKVCDYRCAFGVIYGPVLADYDFWGHTDLDCIYGRVERYVTEEFLSRLDIHSNHIDYVSGPWTLYRNTPAVNELFLNYPRWQDELERPGTTGWVEMAYSDIVDEAHRTKAIRRVYTNWQTKNLDDFSTVRFDGDTLLEGPNEVMMAHFRRTKQYPKGCL